MAVNYELPQVMNEEGKIVELSHEELSVTIYKALQASGTSDRLLALNLADKVLYRLSTWVNDNGPLSQYDISNMIKFVLYECGQIEAAKLIGEKSPKMPPLNLG